MFRAVFYISICTELLINDIASHLNSNCQLILELTAIDYRPRLLRKGVCHRAGVQI